MIRDDHKFFTDINNLIKQYNFIFNNLKFIWLCTFFFKKN